MYRPTNMALYKAFNKINKQVFDNGLERPSAWMCINDLSYVDREYADPKNYYMDKKTKLKFVYGEAAILGIVNWFDDHKTYMELAKEFVDKAQFLDTVAHEMVHLFQWQYLGMWDELGYSNRIDHGRTFKSWIEPCLEFSYDIMS